MVEIIRAVILAAVVTSALVGIGSLLVRAASRLTNQLDAELRDEAEHDRAEAWP